jgi:drug/metabolite transporter (DMT)-like permease
MIGHLIALMAAASQSGSSVSMRKAVFRIGETNVAYFITISIGTIIFTLAIMVSGDAEQIMTVSGTALAAVIGSGIIGLVIGRWLAINSLRIVGSNLTSPLGRMSTVVAVILGVTIMDEPITLGMSLSLILIIVGMILISTEGGSILGPDSIITKREMIIGIMSGLLAGTCHGIGPVLTKVGIEEGMSPITAAFVRYWAAIIVVLVMLLKKGERRKLKKVDKAAFIPLLSGSIFQAIAQFCRNWALEFIPVSVMQPLASTSILFILPLSYAINRKIEIFSWKIVVGAVFVFGGVFMLFYFE